MLLYWDQIVLMVSPKGNWIKYSYEEPIVMIGEIDGARIVSQDKCEFVQRVPSAKIDRGICVTG